MTTTDRIIMWGRLLWGERWQSALASECRLNLRTVQRWAAGTGSPSESVIEELRGLARQRIADIKAALRE